MEKVFRKLKFDPQVMDERLTRKINPWEFFAIVFALGMLIGMIVIHPDSLHYDLSNYLKTSNGDFSFYYYGYWFVPVFQLLGKLPVIPVFILWNIISILCVFLAVRIFGGNPVFTLVSYQMLYILYQGQMTAWVIGALALLWWGMAHKKWGIAGVALLIAATKFQSGLIFAAALWWLADIAWKDRLRILIIPVLLALLSLVIYPAWPIQLISTIQNNPPNDVGNMALWQWIGPYALLLWIPPLILPLKKELRIIALVATMSMALPYFQQADLLTLFALPIGWFPLLGNFGYLVAWFGETAVHLLVLIPLAVYLLIIIPSLKKIRLKSSENKPEISE